MGIHDEWRFLPEKDLKLVESIYNNDYVGFQRAIKAGANVNIQTIETKRTPLMLVSDFDRDTGFIEDLLASGADPAIADAFGLTAIDHANLRVLRSLSERKTVIDWLKKIKPVRSSII